MFGSIINSISNTVDDFVENPVGYVVETVTQPLVDAVDVLDGLSEGELRERAALRLGADAVAGMALSEVIEVLLD